MLIQLDNGVPFGHPVDEGNFRMLFKNTSFPDVLTPEIVEPYGFGIFEYTTQPQPKRFTKVVETTPEKAQNGIFYQSWKIVSLTDSEKNAITEEQKALVRAERNMKLFMSDWTQNTNDCPLTAEATENWRLYRVKLREITNQKGFPWDIIWPNEPSLSE